MRNIALYKHIPGLVLLLTFHVVSGQAPGGSSRPAATAVTPPAAYSVATMNYIRTWEPSMPISDPGAVIASTDISAVKQNTQYFDGLGRLLQTVSKGITPSGKDMVSPVIYDAFGQELYKYLPYVPQTGNTSDGKFKTDPFNGQKAFYQNGTLNPGAAGESIYYGRTEYEASALNRPVKSYAPGNSWAKEGGNRPVEMQYLFNTAADGVRMWDIPAAGGVPTSASGRVFAAGELYKDVSKNERGIRTIEFKDKENRLVLKRVELTSSAADGHTGWLCTYYAYDGLGNLRCVIPPKAVELIKANWIIDANTAKDLCFFYRYDGRNRMIVRKLPGVDSTEMVYDVRDRLVFTRDGNMKGKNQWLVSFFDELNRPAMTALYNSSSTREALQTTMNTATSNTQDISYTFPGVADLEVASYDGRPEYEATNSITFDDGFDTGTGLEMLAEINTNANRGTATVKASNPLPNIPTAALTPLTYIFYDNYSFLGVQTAETADFSKPQAGSNPYAESVTAVSSKTSGLVTGTKVKVLGTADGWMTATIYYNDKGRLIQTVAENISGGKDITTNLYNFNGQRLSSYLKHKNLRSGTTPQLTVLTMLTYDAAGRLKSVKKKLNDNAALERTIVDKTYDELGQPQTKRLGVTGASSQLETLNYEYNIRGWLKGINKNYVNTSGSTSNWFGQELSYDYGFTVNQYNGNVAGAKWKSRGDGVSRAYGYSYDNADRLTAADFSQQNIGSTSWTRDKIDFSVSGLSYDANGNITAMTRKGMVGTAITTIDQLSYSYQANSNKLMAVADPSSTAAAHLGDFINGTNTGDDYSYDVNGNLTKDLNKNISAIVYNHLNLPEILTVTGKGNIQYLYDATGTKLRKITVENTAAPAKTTVTDYIGDFVYQNDTLQFLGHEEGRIRTVFKTGQPVSYTYDYFVKDHLDNVRTILTEQTDFNMYAATMETESAAMETALFSNVEETRTAAPVGYPQDKTTTTNKFVAKLNAKDGGKKIGPSLVLKVMAGDTIQIGAKAFYKSTGPKDNKTVTPEDMIADLIQSFGGQASSSASHGAAKADRLSPFGNLSANDYQRLKERSADPNAQGRPKAYLNFVFFDDQFSLVDENSGVRQVKETPDELQVLAVEKIPVKKSGFLYVYSSNETTQDVFFDNITVTTASGPLLEETHYYPFGLEMAGISNNVLENTAYRKNKLKFNGNELQSDEFSDGSGLDIYNFTARTLDHQLGRFWQLDPLAELHPDYTPYHYALNNPILYKDPWGLDTIRGTTPPPNPKPGDVLVVPGENGKESYYNYNKEGGWVGAGMNGGTLNEVTVTAEGGNSNSKNSQNNQHRYVYASIMNGEDVSGQDVINYVLAGAALTINVAQGFLMNEQKNLARAGLRARELRASTASLTKSLKILDRAGKKLGYVGIALTVANLGYKYTVKGEAITRKDALDAAITITLSVIAISNPFALVGLGVYGLLDATGALDGIKASMGFDDTPLIPAPSEPVLHNMLQ